MTQCDIAIQFVKYFCAADIDGVAALLSPSLKFSGPFFRSDKRQDYIDTLRRDPPQPARYELLSVTEGENHVAIFYRYIKTERTMTLAQLFQFDVQQQIEQIMLVFDGRG